ncbi:ATP-binding protein [Phytoactinopolyspora endophytica]|uniref:ATP-binding protein n=1 Tax=Phytoactinopolyspora endophytica TaxID=1642495 RepID=UPI00101DC37F|nr:ATP-binding protein [Phytoactinopolyspora endophytica]
MGFVNRRTELADLESWWAKPDPRPALVWGRRRVGKTALLQRFSADRRTVFHLGSGRTESGELAQLSRKVANALPDSLRDLAASPYRSWEEAFEHLAQAARDEPLLLVLDEFPEMMTKSPELPGVLRAFLDLSSGRTKLRILLCGSAVRTMRAIQEERAPLYGRFDLSLHVHPFRPHEAAEMLPHLKPADRALVYGLLGGMPLYLSWWDQAKSVDENLADLATRPTSPLVLEGDLVLATESRHGDQVADVLRAIAEGRTKHNEIADAVGTDPSRVLRDLQELRLVERIQPVTETGSSRRRIYRITDNMIAFYLGVLGRYRDEINRGLGETVLAAIQAGVDDHMGACWEDAYRDHLRLRASEIHPETVAVGSWWQSGHQDEIDAVVLAGRARRPVLVGEAKWGRKVNGERIAAQLASKASRLTTDISVLRFSICAREKVTDAPSNALIVTAADIFTR